MESEIRKVLDDLTKRKNQARKRMADPGIEHGEHCIYHGQVMAYENAIAQLMELIK